MSFGARPRRRPGAEEPVGEPADRGPEADQESVARTIVLTKLTAKARTRQELAEALAQRAVPDEVAEAVLDRFTAVGLVDDADFARSYVESRHASRGLSRRALSMELRRKGVADDLIEASLEPLDDDAEYAAARQLLLKKMPSVRNRDPQARWRQLVGLLARRGYSPTLCAHVVNEALRELEQESDEPDELDDHAGAGDSGDPSSRSR